MYLLGSCQPCLFFCFTGWNDLYTNYKHDDIDSGCSSYPSSPSNMSEFSGSTSFDEFSEDLLISKDDALAMGNSILLGGPVINPFIKIKTDDCNEIDNFGEQLLPSNEDLLEMFMNNSELLKEDSCVFDSDTVTSNMHYGDNTECESNVKSNNTLADKRDRDIECAQNLTNDETVQILNVEEQHCIEVKTTSKRSRSSRKRVHPTSNVAIEHSYSCAKNEDSAKDTSDCVEVSQDDRYLEKRRKNNLAAKKSREIKRAREIENIKKFEKLSKENENLLKELKKVQALVTRLEGKLKK